MYPKKIAEYCIELCEDKKGVDNTLVDMKKTGFVDYFVICTATSENHARAIAEDIEKGLKKKKVKLGHKEGLYPGNWILLDFFSVVVHIFTEEMRAFYSLEDLWCKKTEGVNELFK